MNCALYDLQKAGITYLKIVGRGNYTEFMQQDIIRLKKALMILETAETKREFRDRMKQELFPDGCSQNCYY